MTQICFIGAEEQNSLRLFHSQLIRLFDSREALRLKREIDFVFQFTINDNSWCCLITEAKIFSRSQKDSYELLNLTGINFINNCQKMGRICLGIVRVANGESENEAIARLSNQRDFRNIDSILKSKHTEYDAFYC